MDNNYEMIQKEVLKQEMVRVLECNEYTAKFGLTFSEEDTRELMTCRLSNLKEQERIEFGKGILPDIIKAFCDSPYIYQDNYLDVIIRLQEIFYEYKNESMDELNDNELINYMKRHFDGDCQGSLEYLEETCLEKIARQAREDFDGYIRRHGIDDI